FQFTANCGYMKKEVFLIALIFQIIVKHNQSFGKSDTSRSCVSVPGVVIAHQPASTRIYIGSPSICILNNGDYVASHDFFKTDPKDLNITETAIYKSSDNGRTWDKISLIQNAYWSTLFLHQ